MHNGPADHSKRDDTRAFIEELLRTGLMLTDLFSSLLEDLSEDAFPGEDRGEVLLDMVTGTIRPAAEAAGIRTVREATMLLGAVQDLVLADIRTAVELAGPD
jgi:hypothetical protein